MVGLRLLFLVIDDITWTFLPSVGVSCLFTAELVGCILLKTNIILHITQIIVVVYVIICTSYSCASREVRGLSVSSTLHTSQATLLEC